MNMNERKPVEDVKQEQVIYGVVGAFLFSLVGGVIWFVLYQIGYLAWISGFVGVVCAIKGYAVFAKKESIKGIVISVIVTALVIILAWYLCIGFDIYNAYQNWYEAGEIDFTLDFFESIRAIPYFMIDDSSILVDYLMDLGLGLLFCALGCISAVRTALARIKAAQAAKEHVPVQEAVEGEGDLQSPETPVEKTPDNFL